MVALERSEAARLRAAACVFGAVLVVLRFTMISIEFLEMIYILVGVLYLANLFSFCLPPFCGDGFEEIGINHCLYDGCQWYYFFAVGDGFAEPAEHAVITAGCLALCAAVFGNGLQRFGYGL